jgi:hypothetical protein
MIFYGVISQPKASLTALCTGVVGALVYRLWKRSHPPDDGEGNRRTKAKSEPGQYI